MSYNSVFRVVGGASTFFLAWTWFGRLEGGPGARDGYSGLGLAVGLAAAAILWQRTRRSSASSTRGAGRRRLRRSSGRAATARAGCSDRPDGSRIACAATVVSAREPRDPRRERRA